MEKIYLKKNREKSVLQGHPWIFSGAIQAGTTAPGEGEMVRIHAHDGPLLGYGYYNRRTPIAARMLSFGERRVDRDLLAELIRNAILKRTENPLIGNTDALRLIFSEGDFLPGLVVDNYDNHLVVQFLTLGMDTLKDTVIELLTDLVRPESIYERSEHEGRKLEGLGDRTGQITGNTPAGITIREDDVSLHIDLHHGQKTGFFIDQRDNRRLIGKISRDKKVLNLFSYSGAFSVHALRGGAREAVSVDASRGALELAERNAGLNGFLEKSRFIKGDVFQYLREEDISASVIICDPPALVKSRSSVEQGCRGYKDLNLQIARKCPARSMLLTCSCSRFIDMDLFQKVVFAAFSDAGRRAAIMGKYTHPADHPVSINCPETEYLKAILLYVE